MGSDRPNSRAVATSSVRLAAVFMLLATATAACGSLSESATEGRTPATIADSESNTTSGDTSTTSTGAQPDDLSFTDAAEPAVEAPTTTQAPTTTLAPATTQAPTTTAPATIELTKVEIHDLHGHGWVATDPEGEATLKRQVLEAFASQDLDWLTDTVGLYQYEPTAEHDGGTSTVFLAAAETPDAVIHASVTESISTGYFRDGVEVGQEGHTCIFWDSCPAGVTADDYDFQRIVEIQIGELGSTPGGCVIATAMSMRVQAGCE